MPRTSADDVRMELEADGYPIEAITDPQLTTVGIEPASLLVDEELAGTDLSDERLKLIERYLAGHNILSSGVDELRQTDKATNSDGSSTDYAGDRDHTDLRSTSLGQKAIQYDPSDTLANMNKPTASLSVPDVRGN